MNNGLKAYRVEHRGGRRYRLLDGVPSPVTAVVAPGVTQDKNYSRVSEPGLIAQ